MRVPILIAVVLLVPLFTPGPPSQAAEVWRTQFNEAVYGDVTVVGNAVLTCPTAEQAGPEPKYPPQSCVDGLNRKGHGPSAQNNAHRMSYADVDDDRRVAAHVHAVARRQVNEASLLGARDHPNPDAGLAVHLGYEVAAVLGLAGRARRGGDDLVDFVRFREAPELGEGLKGRGHRRRDGAGRPRLRDALRQGA